MTAGAAVGNGVAHQAAVGRGSAMAQRGPKTICWLGLQALGLLHGGSRWRIDVVPTLVAPARAATGVLGISSLTHCPRRYRVAIFRSHLRGDI